VNEDNDLKRMFEAQRKVDEGLAPAFDDIEAKLHPASNFRSAASDRKFGSLPVPVALSAIGLTVVIGLAIWNNTPRPDEPDVSSASQADLQKLNRICDLLLVRIEEQDSETMTSAGTVEQEMDWPTGTDSLIPFETDEGLAGSRERTQVVSSSRTNQPFFASVVRTTAGGESTGEVEAGCRLAGSNGSKSGASAAAQQTPARQWGIGHRNRESNEGN